MLQIQFVKEGLQHYIVIGWEGLWGDDYERNLMSYDAVPGFIPYEVRELNGNISLYYRMSYKTNVNSALPHISLTGERLFNIISDIVKVNRACKEYLLDPEGIVYDTRQVFMNVTTGHLQFCYFPEYNAEKGTLREFMTKLMEYADRKQEKSMMILLKFYNLITDPDCSLEKMEIFCKEIGGFSTDKQFVEAINVNENEKEDKSAGEKKDFIRIKENSSNKMNKSANEKADKKKMVRLIFRIIMIIIAAVDFVLLIGLICNLLTYEKTGYLFVGMAILIGMTIIYMGFDDKETPDNILEDYIKAGNSNDDKNAHGKIQIEDYYSSNDLYDNIPDIEKTDERDEETVLLTPDMEYCDMTIAEERSHGRLYLESMIKDRYEPVHIRDNSVVIGSMKEGCDYLLKARGISRLHAKIMKKDDGMYLLDLNSTNGTYINGELIDSGKDYKLEEGDMVSFAGSQFYVVGEV